MSPHNTEETLEEKALKSMSQSCFAKDVLGWWCYWLPL